VRGIAGFIAVADDLADWCAAGSAALLEASSTTTRPLRRSPKPFALRIQTGGCAVRRDRSLRQAGAALFSTGENRPPPGGASPIRPAAKPWHRPGELPDQAHQASPIALEPAAQAGLEAAVLGPLGADARCARQTAAMLGFIIGTPERADPIGPDQPAHGLRVSNHQPDPPSPERWPRPTRSGADPLDQPDPPAGHRSAWQPPRRMAEAIQRLALCARYCPLRIKDLLTSAASRQAWRTHQTV